jgi:predicted deacylase
MLTYIPIQQLNNGQTLELVKHTFNFSENGPKIYFQAGLHGSEIFGSFLLGKIINQIQSLSDSELAQLGACGQLTIMTTANPIGAQNTVYNSMTGRWNPISGNNWNRIFATREFDSLSEMKQFYENQLRSDNLSIESKLASHLALSAVGSDYIIDIHTTGRQTIDHIFSHQGHAPYFIDLQPKLNLYTKNQPASASFENGMVWPIINSSDKVPITCTWEASCHSIIDFGEITVQQKNLWNWLKNVWSGKFEKVQFEAQKAEIAKQIKGFDDTEADHLVAPFGGYLSWTVGVGELVKKGQKYAEFYQPHSHTFIDAIAKFDFILIGSYGIGAIAEGEQIAFIVRV